jgi:hypothetical protein
VLGLLAAGSGKRRTMTADENTENSLTDWLKQTMAEFATPESKLRFEKEDRFLREVIYAGLTDLNTGFDSPLIGHFSPEDFLIVIDRCEALNVRVIGIEVIQLTRNLGQRWSWWISKSLPKRGTTGRAYWSGSTWRDPT